MTSDSKVTRNVVERFHNAFEKHRPEDLDDLIGEGCVLENTTPAPDGALYEGRAACLAFWKKVASSANLAFKAEEISAIGDRGIIRWQLRWGEREADRVRGVNIMRVRDGKIVEGLGYVKGADVPITNRRSSRVAIPDCARRRVAEIGHQPEGADPMIIIAGYTRTNAERRDDTVEAFRGMVERARAYDGCLDFSISADALDPERVNLFERWRDQTTLDAWRKIAKGPRKKPREAAVSLYRTDKAEKPF